MTETIDKPILNLPYEHPDRYRKTVANCLDEAGLTARQIADHLGHAHPSVTQDFYMGPKWSHHRPPRFLKVVTKRALDQC